MFVLIVLAWTWFLHLHMEETLTLAKLHGVRVRHFPCRRSSEHPFPVVSVSSSHVY